MSEDWGWMSMNNWFEDEPSEEEVQPEIFPAINPNNWVSREGAKLGEHVVTDAQGWELPMDHVIAVFTQLGNDRHVNLTKNKVGLF
jgi:hypothetical protein